MLACVRVGLFIMFASSLTLIASVKQIVSNYGCEVASWQIGCFKQILIMQNNMKHLEKCMFQQGRGS
jgi:hypothetical protein